MYSSLWYNVSSTKVKRSIIIFSSFFKNGIFTEIFQAHATNPGIE
jgi:hypothetical protein